MIFNLDIYCIRSMRVEKSIWSYQVALYMLHMYGSLHINM